jgi:hypothetical protein
MAVLKHFGILADAEAVEQAKKSAGRDYSEDGILINPELLEKLTFKPYQQRVVEFGNKAYPLNVYGG